MSRDTNRCNASKPIMSVGALSRRSGISVSAIHSHEREGLIRSTRDGANHRRYSRASLRVLAITKAGQRAGSPLAELREALSTTRSGKVQCREEWQRVSER